MVFWPEKFADTEENQVSDLHDNRPGVFIVTHTHMGAHTHTQTRTQFLHMKIYLPKVTSL